MFRVEKSPSAHWQLPSARAAFFFDEAPDYIFDGIHEFLSISRCPYILQRPHSETIYHIYGMFRVEKSPSADWQLPSARAVFFFDEAPDYIFDGIHEILSMGRCPYILQRPHSETICHIYGMFRVEKQSPSAPSARVVAFFERGTALSSGTGPRGPSG